MAKLYPIGIQNFKSLRQDGYIYVDKTELIYQLVKAGRYYFISRPHREKFAYLYLGSLFLGEERVI